MLAGMLLLSGCGGGSTPATQSLSCELPLKYADGAYSGYSIGPLPTKAVPRQFSACAIRQIQSASVSLCIDHQQIGELSAQMILPGNTVQSLSLPSAQANANGCLLSGKLYTVTLPASALQGLSASQGEWAVSVSDTNQVSATPVGYLVGWSLRLDGLR